MSFLLGTPKCVAAMRVQKQAAPRRPRIQNNPFATTADRVGAESVQSGTFLVLAQALRFILQTGSVMILARLLSPEDYGIYGMVVAMAGFLALFGDASLSMATIQREVITSGQVSALFWLNTGLGLVLTIITAALAPALAAFYREPRLVLIVIIWAVGFLFDGLAVQHRALLQRNMRFGTLVAIDLLAFFAGATLAITMALHGSGYWALVLMSLSNSVIRAFAVWLTLRWIPGSPCWGSETRSMIRYGSIATLNNIVDYVSSNIGRVFLGRFYGAVPLGLYGRASQLVNLPTTQMHSTLFVVGLSGLSRIQNDLRRLRKSFLTGYSALLSLTLPSIVFSILFADDLVRIALGPQWIDAVPVFRLFGPAVFVFAITDPLGWLLTATGRAARKLRIAILVAPVVTVATISGLYYGLAGVALAYSVAMLILSLPIITLSIHQTGIAFSDLRSALKAPICAGFVAAVVAWPFSPSGFSVAVPATHLIIGFAVYSSAYMAILLMHSGQRVICLDFASHLVSRVRPRP